MSPIFKKKTKQNKTIYIQIMDIVIILLGSIIMAQSRK